MPFTATNSAPASGPSAAGTPSANPSSRASPAVGAPPTTQASITKPKPVQGNPNGTAAHPQAALSNMTSLPLDLSSVERRGLPTAPKEPVKKTGRMYDLEDAPVYQPTEEEWKDPMDYIRKITPEAKNYGICKIIPPDAWNPDFAIDTERFHFRTRKQDLNSVEGSSRANISYVDSLLKFHKQNGGHMVRMPYVDKRPLDLWRLKKAVESRGGFEKVCRSKKWAEIGRDLGYSGKIMSSLSTSLKNSYQKWLCPYEEYLRLAKPGVYQQLETENGGPLTPSPAPSPMKHSNMPTPSSLRGESPARFASSALQVSVNSERATPVQDTPTAAPTTGFTAINSGGFTAVNSGFTSANRQPAADVKSGTPSKQFTSPMTSAKNTPEYRPSGLGPANSLKRQMSVDSLDSSRENGTDKDEDNGSRRSKRLKKESVPTVAGSHMSMFRPMPRLSPREETSGPGEKCTHCGKAEEIGFLAVCESCDHAYHGACLDPPLKAKPDSEWNCPRCLVGDGQFGFEEGGLYSLRQFQEKAADFKQGYFEKRMPFDPVLGCARPVTEDDVEREFWRLVTDVDEEVQVEYGADIHCTTHGSGFPTVEKHPNNPYSSDPWNLNVLPYHHESLFRHIKSDISGMTVPWVYVGMIFSTFCYHNEDHYAYSANYQHFGATKTWYGIPAEDTDKFEKAMKEAVPELFETNPDLLFQLVTLLTPDQLKKAGVRVYAVDQRAGQMVITFPSAYHAGFNHGFNFNEAVNFAPCDWEPFGLDGVERLQAYRRQPCFSHDELLWTAADGTISNTLTIQTARWLAPALERIHRREFAEREDFIAKHLAASPHNCALGGENDGEQPCPISFKIDDTSVSEEEYSCAYCKAFAYLSRFKCLTSGKVYCLMHAGSQPCCDATQEGRYLGQDHELIFRKLEEVITSTSKKVSEKASVPEAWEEKYDKVLDEEATPSLKTLRNLLNEGERIPYELKTLPLLRAFVDRCNRWVEEATNYTIRKQQNRRKNEKAWQTGLRKSIGSAYQDEKERELRKADNITRLLREAEQIGFDCPEIQLLQDRADAIRIFQENAMNVISHPSMHQVEAVEELLEEGNGFNVDLKEMDKLSKVLDKLKWNQKAKANRSVFMSSQEVAELVEEARRSGIEAYNDHLSFYVEQLTAGFQWEKKAKEIIDADVIHYPQLEALSQQAMQNLLPVSAEVLAQVDQILHKQREALRQIADLNARTRNKDFRKRPRYTEVADIMKMVEDLQSKPPGTLDLEKEQRRHEDWMRKGKKLFGKTNAPLHILKSHMEYVLERNLDCFDITKDKPRLPAEPASREPTPEKEKNAAYRWDDPKFREVFCICRRIEAGMMIECELCHEWYHGKCLKIARGKVKEEDKYTCPICDWRVKIPRDAARPRLEDLLDWDEEIPNLPFQPEEETVLKQIIDNAQTFRNHIQSYCNPVLSTRNEAETQRFYLRKIEGAEILLSNETNFFRQELHKWHPVAPNPPPVIEASKSTRKPRPTKLDKLLLQHGVANVEDLPDHVKSKGLSLKRKRQNAEMAAQAHQQAIAGSSTAGPATSPGINSYASYYQRSTSSQPQTPGLSIASSSHAHPSRGPGSASSSTHPFGRADSSGPVIRPENMDLDSTNANIHPNFFLPTGGGPQIMADSSSGPSLEDRLLRGQPEDSTLKDYMATEAGQQKALEMLAKTQEGRRKAEEIFGPGAFDAGRAAISGQDDAGIDDGAVDQMFADMVNQDDEDELKIKGKGAASKGSDSNRDEEKITAESLENERNGMDALLDGD